MKLFFEILLLLLIVPYLPDALKRKDFPKPVTRLLWYLGLLFSELLVIFPIGLRNGKYSFSHVFWLLLCAALTVLLMLALLVLWVVYYARPASVKRIVLNILTAAEILTLAVTLDYRLLILAGILTLTAGIFDGLHNP